MQRRTLLQRLTATALAPAAMALAPAARAQRRRDLLPPDTVLVLLEMRGGNDGLNTVIPWRDPLYAKARPRLAIDQPISPMDGLGLHPALAPMEPLFRQGRLSFALGVGWPVPSRSHFKAMDQWATGSSSGEGPGWLAAALDQRGSSGPLLALGPTGSTSLEGGTALALQLAPEDLKTASPWLLPPERAADNRILRRMLELESAGARELARLRQGLPPLPQGMRVPAGPLAEQLRLALRLIASPLCPPVLALTQTGYDTHANQSERHGNHLRVLAQGLESFDAGLTQMRRRPRVLLLAVSEFGRRFRENGSRGTDHGSASVAILYGDPVGHSLPHPWLGTYPSLATLDARGDLIPSLRPDALYRQVLRSLWG